MMSMILFVDLVLLGKKDALSLLGQVDVKELTKWFALLNKVLRRFNLFLFKVCVVYDDDDDCLFTLRVKF